MPQDEQEALKTSLTSSSSTHALPAVVDVPVAPTNAASDENRTHWELEKQKLYQQLDDKVLLLYISLSNVT